MSRSFNATANQALSSTTGPEVLGTNTKLKTIVGWIRPSTLHLGTAIGTGRSSGGTGYLALGTTATGEVFAEAAGDSFPSGKVEVNKWSFVAMVVEPEANLRGWLETNKAATATSTGGEQAQTIFTLGALDVNGSLLSFFEGEIAEVAVFEGVLSDENIKLLAAKHNPVNITLGEKQKLVGYWQLKGEAAPEPSYEGLGPSLAVGTSNHGKGTSSPEIEAPGGGGETVYNEGPLSGALTITGSLTDTLEATEALSGTLTLTGSVIDSQEASEEVSGTVVPTGSLTESLEYVEAPSGSLSIVGTVTDSTEFTDELIGNVAIIGTVADSGEYSDQVSGAAIPLGVLTGESYEVEGEVEKKSNYVIEPVGAHHRTSEIPSTAELSLFARFRSFLLRR